MIKTKLFPATTVNGQPVICFRIPSTASKRGYITHMISCFEDDDLYQTWLLLASRIPVHENVVRVHWRDDRNVGWQHSYLYERDGE